MKGQFILGFALLMLMLSGAFAYECDGNSMWWAHDDAAAPLYDSCVGHNGTETGTPGYGASGVFGDAITYSGDDYFTIADHSDFDVASYSFCWWAKTSNNNDGKNKFILRRVDTGVGGEYFISAYQAHTSNYVLAAIYDGATLKSVTYDTAINDGDWRHFCMIKDDATNNLTLYVNGTYHTHTAQASLDTMNSEALTIGGIASAGNSFIGELDEVNYFPKALSESEISNIFTYNNLSGAPPESFSVTLNNPTDNDHDNTAPDWNYTPVWAGGIVDANVSGCHLYANTTLRASNSTAVVNNTVNTISWTPGEGTWEWFVGCEHTNGTSYNSTSRTFTFDTTAPEVSIHSPTTATTEYWRNSNILLNATYEDNIDLFNCSIDVYRPNESLFFSNSTLCSGTSFTWDNQTITPDTTGTWRAVFSAMDSHTAQSWKPDHWTKDGAVLHFSDEKGYKVTFLGADKPGATPPVDLQTDVEELFDRIKWTYRFTGVRDFTYLLRIDADHSLHYRPHTPYAGHFVINGRNWMDYQDLVDTDFDFEVREVGERHAIVAFTPPGTGMGYIVADPATGGLNYGSAEVDFVVNGMMINAYDEHTLDPLTNWTVAITNSTSSRTFTEQDNPFTWDNFTDIPTGPITVTVTRDGYIERSYYRTFDVAAPVNLNTYLLSTSDGVYSYFTVRSATETNLPGALLVFTFTDGGNTITAGEAKTDDTGSATMWLDWRRTYQVTASLDGYTPVTRSLTPQPTNYVIIMGAGTLFEYQYINESLWVFMDPAGPDINPTETITAGVFDPNSTLSICGLNLTYSNGTMFATTNTTTEQRYCTNALLLNSTTHPTTGRFYAVLWWTADGTSGSGQRPYRIQRTDYSAYSAQENLYNYLGGEEARLITATMITLFAGVAGAMYLGSGAVLIMMAVSGLFFMWGWFVPYNVLWFIAVLSGLAVLYLERGAA